MDIRPLASADIDACVEVFYAADEALTASLNLPLLPRNPVALSRIFSHVSRSTPARSWVAERDGRVLGFGMAAERDDLCFLAFLFVRPEAQGSRIGSALYERSMPRAGYRATCIWSVQPISAALYARHGLVPRVPLYTFVGRPRTPLPPLPAGLSLGPISQDEIDVLDREVIGLTRRVDHDAWRAWERRPFGLRDRLRVVGYGYAQRAGRIGPAVVRRPEHLLPLIGALMDEVESVEDWMIHVPGVAAEPFAALLRAGMRFDGPPILYCATESRIDHSRYLPATFALP